MIALAVLFRKLLDRIDRGIDWTPCFLLGLGERWQEIRRCHVAHHHKIDVTALLFLSACDRAVDEGTSDSLAQWIESRSENHGYPHGFADEGRELGQVGAIAIGRVVDLPSLGASAKDACLDQ